MKCSVCGKPVQYWHTLNVLPTYYVGPKTNSLQDVTHIFCGPKCSLEWYEAQKNEIQKDSKGQKGNNTSRR